jgi:hypothetical protein
MTRIRGYKKRAIAQPTTDTIWDFRFWILDWEHSCLAGVLQNEIMQIQTKMV